MFWLVMVGEFCVLRLRGMATACSVVLLTALSNYGTLRAKVGGAVYKQCMDTQAGLLMVDIGVRTRSSQHLQIDPSHYGMRVLDLPLSSF